MTNVDCWSAQCYALADGTKKEYVCEGQFCLPNCHLLFKGRCQNILREGGAQIMGGSTSSTKNRGSVDELGTFFWGWGIEMTLHYFGGLWMTCGHFFGGGDFTEFKMGGTL